MKCPYCQSDRLRRSRHRPEDGLWRSIFYTAYRCRACGQRAQHLTSGLLLGGVITAALSAAFVLGYSVHALLDNDAPPPMQSQAGGAAAIGATATEATTPSVPAPEYALAAAAEQGDPMAQLRFGLALLNGNGGERNPAAGLTWIEKAAAQNYAEAQYTLGTIFLSGRGALQSFSLALEWFERAAQRNNAEAQYGLGMMYRNGQGVPVDKSKAYFWFNLSAAQGHERARDARDSLLSSLTAEQVLAAQRAAREWRPVVAAQ